MKITILEGPRGVGKSTIARILRDGLTNTLLINPTGNNDDSEEGKDATFKHYENLLTLLSHEQFDDSPFNYLFDRVFFSEQVYSTLYKSYDFTKYYRNLLSTLDRIANKVDVTVVFLYADKYTLERNLNREGKANLFDSEKFSDDVHKSMEQQATYERVIGEAVNSTVNIKFKRADLTGMTLDESVKFIKYITAN